MPRRAWILFGISALVVVIGGWRLTRPEGNQGHHIAYMMVGLGVLLAFFGILAILLRRPPS